MQSITPRIVFPEFSGLRCLMMPYIQGEPASVPREYRAYSGILRQVFLQKGDIGYLTIDESFARAGAPHRGDRAKTKRALHTEAGRDPHKVYCWGSGGKWGGGKALVTLDRDTQILLANSADDTCAVWHATHEDTSDDGDIGHAAALYPMGAAELMKAGDLRQIGILTPHESLPVKKNMRRQFLRIVGSGVHGREPYFTENPVERELTG